jgi:hypothetical protein
MSARTPIALLAGALVVAALAPVAHAKPKVAVLGLEVVEDGAIDAKTTTAAKQITSKLRGEASKSESKLELADDSNKDLLELKLLSDCSDEGRRCMAEIGKELKAEFLLYGRIEKRKNGYQVSLKLLETGTAQMAKTTSDIVPFADATDQGLSRWSHSFYARLTGAPEDGALVVRANVDSGMVYIDGELKTNLSGGSAKVAGLSEGVHRVTIEADGKRRYDAEIAISSGQTEELAVSLSAEGGGGGGGGEGRPGGGWRAAFWTATIATAAGATGWSIELYRYTGPLKEDQLDAVKQLNGTLPSGSQLLEGDDACAGAGAYLGDADPSRAAAAKLVDDRCKTGQFHANMTLALGVATGVSAIAAAIFDYKGYVAAGEGSHGERSARRHEKRSQPTVRFTPSLSPTTVGAGLAFEF